MIKVRLEILTGLKCRRRNKLKLSKILKLSKNSMTSACMIFGTRLCKRCLTMKMRRLSLRP